MPEQQQQQTRHLTYTFPTEAELAQGREHSTMTRDEALRALDRATRLCALLMARIEELQDNQRELVNVLSDSLHSGIIDFRNEPERAQDILQKIKQERDNASGEAHSSNEDPCRECPACAGDKTTWH